MKRSEILLKEDSLTENTWHVEFNHWLEELQIRRLDFMNAFDENNKLEIDPFNDLSDRCWGEINGNLSLQYFALLQELKFINLDLYEKYRFQALTELDFRTFFSVPKSNYTEYYKNNPNPYSRKI